MGNAEAKHLAFLVAEEDRFTEPLADVAFLDAAQRPMQVSAWRQVRACVAVLRLRRADWFSLLHGA